jgi:hypothetical protein
MDLIALLLLVTFSVEVLYPKLLQTRGNIE